MKQLTLILALTMLCAFPVMAARKGGGGRAGGGARKAGAGARKAGAGAHAAKHKAHAKNHKASGKHAGAHKEHREKHQERASNRQAKRIEHGFKNGSLTPGEVDGLKSSAKSIANMQSSFKSDGKITKSEGKELRSALNSLSKDIFFEKHDTEGHQMAVRRLGKGRTVYLNSEILSKFENGELTGKAARAITSDMHKMVNLRIMLGGHVGLATSKRAKLQAEYNNLLNKYFVEGEQEELSRSEKTWQKSKKEKWDNLNDEQKEKIKAAWKKRWTARFKNARKRYHRNHKEDGGDDE